MARRCLGAIVALALWLAALPAEAQGFGERQQPDPDQPILLSADQVTYSRDGRVVTASGNVEISQGDRIVLADMVRYEIQRGIVIAEGNISLLEPTGDVLFADYLELDDELATGFMRSIRILMSDQSRFAANGAVRTADERTILSKAVYSPCRICPESEASAPLWQLKAVRVEHDRSTKEIRYQDAILEVYGVPVAYTPFFQHPDPSVKRKTGFLAPEFGSDSELGATIRLPYFMNLAPDRDFTFSPLFTSNEGGVAIGEYRQATENGEYALEGSLTYVRKRDANNIRTEGNEVRGHLFGKGRFDIDNRWRWGFDVARATDDTYLRRYNFSDDDTLTSDIFVEGFHGRSYAAAEAFTFQGLRVEDDDGLTPVVLPLLTYDFVAPPSRLGGRFGLNVNMVSLYRTESTDTRRLSLSGEWRRPFITGFGLVATAVGQLRSDLYWTNGVRNPGQPAEPSSSGGEARLMPQAMLDLRYPLVRSGAKLLQTIEPIVQLIASPYGGNPSDIPNEDSLSVEFDETNLFSDNRFPGYDRVESGPRINYGAKGTIFATGGGVISATAGGVLRAKDDDTFAENSGLDGTTSDYVTSLTVAPTPYLSVTNRTRLDRDNLALRRNEVYFTLGPKWLRLMGSYVQLDKELTANELQAREELFLAARARLTEFLSLTALTRRDLTNDGGQIETNFAVEYADECILLRFEFDRDYTRDRDVEPSTSISFRVVLRNLG